MSKFIITEDHVKLLGNAYIRWEDCEYGAPAMDFKRPYGNSDVEIDVANILGWEPEGDDGYEKCFSSDQRDAARSIHLEMEQVLQIVVKTWVAP